MTEQQGSIVIGLLTEIRDLLSGLRGRQVDAEREIQAMTAEQVRESLIGAEDAKVLEAAAP